MKSLKELFFEKLVIDNTVTIFDKKKIASKLKTNYFIDDDSPIGKYMINWAKNNNVKNFEAYDGGNFSFLGNGHAKFNQDRNKFDELKNTLLNDNKHDITENDDHIYYSLSKLCGIFSKDHTVGMIFVKL